MVNQTRQDVIHSCKWGDCKQKFNSIVSLWKHVEQHVDNAIPRLIHLVNDDDDAPVTEPHNGINSASTSRVNRSNNLQPAHINTTAFNTAMNDMGNINNVNLMRPILNLQSTQPSQLQVSHMLTQTAYQHLLTPTQKQLLALQYTAHRGISTGNYLAVSPVTSVSPQFQQIVGGRPTFLIPQSQQIIQSTSQSASVQQMIPLGSMPNPITIDDNNVMDVDPPIVNHQRLGRPPAVNNSKIQLPLQKMQKKVANLNRNAQYLSQNTKK